MASPRTASPGTPGAASSVFNLDNKAFGEYVTALSDSLKELATIGLAVGALPKGQRLWINEPTLINRGLAEVGRRNYHQMVSTVVRKIRELKKFHKEALKPKKRGTIDPVTGLPVKRGGGFSLPIRISDDLRGFFTNANLGLIEPRLPPSSDNTELRENLPLLTKYGITSPSLLTPLFSIYALVNGLQNGEQRNLLHADEYMRQALGTTLATLQATVKDHPGKQPKNGGAPRMIPGFNPDAFPYSYLQKIIKENKLPQTKDEQKALMADTTVMANLHKEQDLVSKVLDIYREINAPAEKQRRTDKRRAAAAAKKAAAAAARA